jgi:hypothetical protein
VNWVVIATQSKLRVSFVVYKGVVDRVGVRSWKHLREFAKSLNQGGLCWGTRPLEEGLLKLFAVNALEFNPVLGEHRE